MNLLTSNFGITVNGETLPTKLFNQLNPEQLSNFFTRLREIITNPEIDPSTLPSQLQELIESFFPEDTVVVGNGALQKLGINTETYKNGLYEKIISAVKQGSALDLTTRNNIVEQIKKQNETLGSFYSGIWYALYKYRMMWACDFFPLAATEWALIQ